MNKFITKQEEFWAGEFGNEYISRNDSELYIPSNIALFSKIFNQTKNINSVIEFGANVGLNLMAINQLLPNAKISAVEINEKAATILQQKDYIHTYIQSILDFIPPQKYDFVLIMLVLIHINPEQLDKAYQLLYEASKRYICISEYYNPIPVEVNYRGHQKKLFKRDFAGEMLDRFSDLKLINYGFCYHRDTHFPQDDINWFLLEKLSSSSS